MQKHTIPSQPQIYYYVIADCDGKTLDEGEQMRFDVNLFITNDGKEFSEEEDGMLLFYISAFIAFSVVLGGIVY